MAISVVMPALEMAQETGKLLAWRKKEGDSVTKGEPLLEIETDKAVVEIESPADGILAGVNSREGAVVPVGVTIAWIVAPGEAVPAQSTSTTLTGRNMSTSSNTIRAFAETVAPPNAPASVSISPKARRLANEHGIDITTIRGTGPDGVITTEDVLAVKDSQRGAATSMTGPSSAPLSTVARIMAERTAQSWSTVPHFFVLRHADASALVAIQKRFKAESVSTGKASPSITDCLVSLVAQTLGRYPTLNASWSGDNIRLNPEINISLAIAVGDGVVAPVIKAANTLSISQVAVHRVALGERARAGRLQPADLSGGTFSISNLGMYKVESFTAIITPPQAAILAVGAIADRVVAVEGNPTVRPMFTLNLSSDHRVVDGARAAAFLNDLVNAIHDPVQWLRLR